MVIIIDYGLGNLASVQKALDVININSKVSSNISEIENAEYLVLPGVGSFEQGMLNLKRNGLDDIIRNQVINSNKKILGFCLGMQLLFEYGTEGKFTEGLGLVKGHVEEIDSQNIRVPHMGWNTITPVKGLFFDNLSSYDFYFIHSYHCLPKDNQVVSSIVNYGFDMVSSIKQNNITAMQFHPEKSQDAGLSLLKEYFIEYKNA